MSSFPTIKLDITFADLYQADGCKTNLPLFIPYSPNSEFDFTANFPRTTKYIYQNLVESRDISPTSLVRRLGIKFLALNPQRYMFPAGNMPVAVFDVFDLAARESRVGKQDAIETLNVLSEAQRPDLRFYSGPRDFDGFGDTTMPFALLLPMDILEKQAHVIEPTLHFELLSKRALAISGLKTPESQILDLDNLPDLEEYCDQSVEQKHDPEAKLLKVKKQLDAAVDFINRRSLPFVLKLQQTVGGLGSFFAWTETQRQDLIINLLPVLQSLLEKVDAINAHLRPSSLIIQDLITGVKDHETGLCVNFFVKKDGQYTCLGVCDQEFTSDGSKWVGGSISYQTQDTLQSDLGATMQEVATFLYGKGYYGPAGVDVMVDDQERQWVVDLNVRSCSSVILGLLRGHFEKERGFHEAVLLPILKFPFDRLKFRRKFNRDLEFGRLIVVSWFYDEVEDIGWASLVLGAEDKRMLKEFVERVRALETKR